MNKFEQVHVALGPKYPYTREGKEVGPYVVVGTCN